jgi:hypothetical protein
MEEGKLITGDLIIEASMIPQASDVKRMWGKECSPASVGGHISM